MEAVGLVTSVAPQTPPFVRSFNNTYSGKCAALFETHVAGKIEHYMGTTALKMGRVVVYNALWLLAHIEQSLSRKSHARLIAFFADMVAASRLLPLNTERLVKCLSHLDELNLAPVEKQRLAQLILDQIVPDVDLDKDLLLKVMVFLGKELAEKHRSYPEFTKRCLLQFEQLKTSRDPCSGEEAYQFLFPILQLQKNDISVGLNISACLRRMGEDEAAGKVTFSEQERLALFFALEESCGERSIPYLDPYIFSPLLDWLNEIGSFNLDQLLQLLPLVRMKNSNGLSLSYPIINKIDTLVQKAPLTPEQGEKLLTYLPPKYIFVIPINLRIAFTQCWDDSLKLLDTMKSQELVALIKFQYQLRNSPHPNQLRQYFDNDQTSEKILTKMRSLMTSFTLEQIGECLPLLPEEKQDELIEICVTQTKRALQSEQLVSCASMLNILRQSTRYGRPFCWSLPDDQAQLLLPQMKSQLLKERSFTVQESAACIGLLLYIYAYDLVDEGCLKMVKGVELPNPLPDFLTNFDQVIVFPEEEHENRAHKFLSELLPEDHPMREEVLGNYFFDDSYL